MSKKASRVSNVHMISAVAVLALLALACGSSTPEVRPAAPAEPDAGQDQASPSIDEEATQPQDQPTSPPAPTQTPKPLGSARSNPAPPGHEVSIGDITVSIVEVIRPATDIVMSGNPFNTEPEQGEEYVFVKVATHCDRDSDETCSILGFEFSLIGSAGVVHEAEIFVAGVEGLYEAGEFFGGALVEGYLPFIVGQDETDLILKYEEILGGEAYLSLGE